MQAMTSSGCGICVEGQRIDLGRSLKAQVQTHVLAELVQTEICDVDLVSEPARTAGEVACEEFGGKDDGRGGQREAESVGIVRVVESEEGVNRRVWAEVKYGDPSEKRNHCRQTEFSLSLTTVLRKLKWTNS